MSLCNHKKKDEIFIVLEKYHQILQNKNMKAARDKSFFFHKTRKSSRTHYREKHYNPIEITNRRNSKTSATYKQKRKFKSVEFL